MKRQFSGREPLWRDSEVMRDTFKNDPERESKLQASLRRLDGAFNALQSQVEVRLHKEQQRCAGGGNAPRKAVAFQRRRQGSAVGRTGARSRPRSCAEPVPTISCPARASGKGAGTTTAGEL
ncbi:rab-6.2 [Symbiodinium natans]|uniref:Rab-6.2 protein n=1 Tax=Symbiodinium natans TaxID=878477 RepID=A0A812LYL9_9DINO|nr:rab-6.2 [Symbiodinium natans]